MSLHSFDIRLFLDRLFTGVDGVVEVRALPSKARAWATPGDWSPLIPFLQTHVAAGQGLYVGVATRCDTTSGTTSNLHTLSHLWVELDRPPAEAEARLRSFAFPCQLLVHSGYGVHAYFQLREPLDLREPATLRRTASLLRRLCGALDGDLRATDPARILRLPDTFNTKYDTPRRVLLAAVADGAINPSELEDVLPAEVIVRNEWTVEGIAKGARNDTLYRHGRSLHSHGRTLPEISRELESINLQWCRPPLDATELKKIVTQVAVQSNRPDFTPPVVIHDATPPPPPPSGTAICVTLGTVEPEAISWHWRGRLAAGKAVLLAGDPGLGKSMLLADIAARYTVGDAWPDEGKAPQGKVVFLCAEDDLADTVRPRLDAAGGNANEVEVFQAVRDTAGERLFNLSRDLPVLDGVLTRVQPKLLCIDPMNSYLGKVDSYRDADVRGVISPLIALVQRHRCALIWVAHLTKASDTKALYRPGASIAFVASSRGAFLLGEHPEQPGLLVLANSKTNNVKVGSLGFRIVASGVKDAGKVEWAGIVDVTADQLLRVRDPDDVEAAGSADGLIAALRQEPALWPLDAKDAYARAELLGIPERTLRRAARRAGLTSFQKGQGRSHRGYWFDPLNAGVHSDNGNGPADSGTAELHAGHAGHAGHSAEVADMADMGDDEDRKEIGDE